MLFVWQGILQFISQSGFSFDSVCFFFFYCSLLFYGYSKNLWRHKRGTKPQIDSLYKKSTLLQSKIIIFKHSLLFIHTFKNTTQLLKTFFVSQSLTNATSLPLIYSISSKHVSDFSARKKKKPDTSGSIFPTTPRGKGQVPTPGKALQIKFPTPPAQTMVKCPGFAWGGGGCRSFDLIGA